MPVYCCFQVITWQEAAYSSQKSIYSITIYRTSCVCQAVSWKIELWMRQGPCAQGTCFLVVVVWSLNHVWLFATLWTAALQASLPFSISWSLLKLMSSESVRPSNHLILCRPLLLLPLIFPNMRVFSSESALLIRSFSFSISPSNEYSGLISFRIDWFDLLAVQGTLKSLLQHHSSKASVLQRSAFLMSNSYIHTWLLEKT